MSLTPSFLLSSFTPLKFTEQNKKKGGQKRKILNSPKMVIRLESITQFAPIFSSFLSRCLDQKDNARTDTMSTRRQATRHRSKQTNNNQMLTVSINYQSRFI